MSYRFAVFFFVFFFFKQKTAYEMRISDWSSDVCSSDLGNGDHGKLGRGDNVKVTVPLPVESLMHIQVGHIASYNEHTAILTSPEIGRASCRERVCQYV